MRRRLSLVLLIVITVASVGSDVFACGDKFLRVGRSARFRGYASVHPSSILVYAPRWTRPGIANFEQMLKHGGHKPVIVTTTDAMSHAVVGGKYDLVITSYADAAAVTKELQALPSRPALLPVVYKATKTETAEAVATYRCLIRPEKMTPFQALEEIDRLIDLRLKEGAATTAAR
jgi:glycosyltransferase involved in cell wall biosynthesis